MLIFALVTPSQGRLLPDVWNWPRRAASAAAVLEQEGHDVRLFDLRCGAFSLASLIELIEAEDPALILIDTIDGSAAGTRELVAACRRVCSGHVCIVGAEAQENRLSRLARALDADSWLEGHYDLTVTAPRSVEETELCSKCVTRAHPRTVDELPSPAWHFLDQKPYSGKSSRHPEFFIEGSLLPNPPHTVEQHLQRSPDKIELDLDKLIRQWPAVREGVVHFHDSRSSEDPVRARALGEVFRRKHLSIALWTRPEFVRAEAISILAASGVRRLCLEMALNPAPEEDSTSVLSTVRSALESAAACDIPTLALVRSGPEDSDARVESWTRALRQGITPRKLGIRVVRASPCVVPATSFRMAFTRMPWISPWLNRITRRLASSPLQSQHLQMSDPADSGNSLPSVLLRGEGRLHSSSNSPGSSRARTHGRGREPDPPRASSASL